MNEIKKDEPHVYAGNLSPEELFEWIQGIRGLSSVGRGGVDNILTLATSEKESASRMLNRLRMYIKYYSNQTVRYENPPQSWQEILKLSQELEGVFLCFVQSVDSCLSQFAEIQNSQA
ncbi:hypothetical protein DAE56_22915 [Salmonella enterica]|nr:hypothetical protein [Salmonella enterica]